MNSWVACGNARNTLHDTRSDSEVHDTRSDDSEVGKKMTEVDTKLQKRISGETGDK